MVIPSGSCGTEADSTVQTRPSRHIAPTSKLTDINNAAQPELSFQRRAVQAFRTRAQEAPPLLEPSSLSDAVTQPGPSEPGQPINSPAPPSPGHHNASLVDVDTEDIDVIEPTSGKCWPDAIL